MACLSFATACVPVDGYIDPTLWLSRQLAWLEFATSTPMNPGSVPNVMAHLERDLRDTGYSVPAGSIPDDAWDGVIDKMWRLRDTSDFDALRFVNLLYGYRGQPAASEALWQKVETALLDFKYWYTDRPRSAWTATTTPSSTTCGTGTENHILIFKVCEFLVGQRFPNEVFTVTGLTGQEHMERARPFLIDWFEERGRFGFTEWHSNVYYNLDLRPLLALAEWSDDEIVAKRATMVLDLVLLDTALHLHQGLRRDPRPVLREGQGVGHDRGHLSTRARCSSRTPIFRTPGRARRPPRCWRGPRSIGCPR